MRSLTRGNIKAALKGLRRNKWRSFLTMLGIIIGVSSVVTVVSIGEGVRQQIAQQINHAGRDLITVRPGQVSGGGLGTLTALTANNPGGALSNRDVDALQKLPNMGAIVPLGVVTGTVQAQKGIYNSGPVIASGAGFASLLNQNVAYGAYFGADDEDNNVAVLGSQAALAMFNSAVPLGSTFSFRGQDFMVQGILNDFAVSPLAADVNYNSAIFIPTGAARHLANGNQTFYEILAKPAQASNTDATIKAMRSALLAVHGDAHDFTILKPSQASEPTNRILNLLTQLVAGVAAISLLVGGIGIMNIMLVSVTERMHEIGIRKAIGATDQQILSEFVSEAAMLSIIGTLIGIVASLIINLLLRIFTSLAPAIDWRIMLASGLIAMLVGIIFGSAPALKAARKDPISALRGE